MEKNKYYRDWRLQVDYIYIYFNNETTSHCDSISVVKMFNMFIDNLERFIKLYLIKILSTMKFWQHYASQKDVHNNGLKSSVW